MIVLECATGVDSIDVAVSLSVSQQTVSISRIRFAANWLDGMLATAHRVRSMMLVSTL